MGINALRWRRRWRWGEPDGGGVGMLWSAAVKLMTHLDPWKRPDLDHGAVAATRGTATSEVAKVMGGLT